MQLPYHLDFRESIQWSEPMFYPIEVKTDEDTRIRVFSTQLMDDVVKNITPSNYLYHVGIYFKLGYKLVEEFPNSKNKVEDSTMILWERVQTKIKRLAKP